MSRTNRPGLVLLTLAAGWSNYGLAQNSGADHQQRYLLRMTADTGVVGHYGFTTKETHRLSFDIPDDDPRQQLLESATAPKERNTRIAATIVSLPRPDEDERRYMLYWLGYSVAGDEVRSLPPLQWDSIFQAAGRRAVIRFSPTGEPHGVEVTSDAVRPVGQAFATMLASLAVGLPMDSVSVGATWHGRAAIPVRRPDGSRTMAPVDVTYRLRQLRREPEGVIARIEFDGAPAETEDLAASGRYFGECMFAVDAGRFEELTALAEIEVEWPQAESGLPPSRSVAQWEGQITRSRGGG